MTTQATTKSWLIHTEIYSYRKELSVLSEMTLMVFAYRCVCMCVCAVIRRTLLSGAVAAATRSHTHWTLWALTQTLSPTDYCYNCCNAPRTHTYGDVWQWLSSLSCVVYIYIYIVVRGVCGEYITRTATDLRVCDGLGISRRLDMRAGR